MTPGIESAQGNTFTMQSPRQQDGGRHFIELDTAPIGIPHLSSYSAESAIRPLNGRQPDQSAQRGPGLARSQEGARALRQVAGPDQVIAARSGVVLGLAPRECSWTPPGRLERSCLREPARIQRLSRIHVTAVGSALAEIGFRFDHRALPLAHIGLAMRLEWLG